MLALWLLAIVWLVLRATRVVRAWRTKVPGPWYTKVSSLPLIWQEWKRNRRGFIHELHTRYGPAVRLSPGQVSFISLEAMKEIYQSGGSGYDKPDFYDQFKQYDQRTMFSLLGREEHSQRKKLFAERYAMSNVARPEVMAGIELRAASVVKKCRAAVGGTLDAYMAFHCYAIDGVSHLLFHPGGTNTLDDPDQREYVEELTYYDELHRRLVEQHLPLLHRLLIYYQPSALLASQKFVLAQRTSDSSAHSILARLCTALPSLPSAAESMDHLAAGVETTGDALCFLTHELSLPRGRPIQTRLRAELRSKPDAKLDDLPYLEAVVKEGLRRYPPIPMSLPRIVPRGGRTIAGYNVPAGEIVSCNAWSMHLLASDVFEEAERFWPERWLVEKGERLQAMNRMFFTFAAGGRGCVGKNLALLEMKTLLRQMYSQFQTSLPPEMEEIMEVDDQVIASRPKGFKALLSFEEVPWWQGDVQTEPRTVTR